MSLFPTSEPETPPADPPCSACGKPAPWVVWTHRVCIPCFQALAEVEPFTTGPIGHADNHAAFTAEATKRTAAWVAQKSESLRTKGKP